VLSRNLRDRRAVARYAGLTGSPDENGSKRREKGLAKAGNARVRHGPVQLAWRFLLFQKDSALSQSYRARTEMQGVQDGPDCRPGPEAAHRLVADGHDRRGSARRRAAGRGLTGRRNETDYQFQRQQTLLAGR